MGCGVRHPNWELRLYEAIEAVRFKPFQWGEFDCFTFAADCVKALTGVDPMAGIRGEYADPRGAYEILNELGGPEKAITDKLESIGYRPCRSRHATRGDIIIFAQQPLKARLGIVNDARAVCPFETYGLAGLSIPEGASAWAI